MLAHGVQPWHLERYTPDEEAALNMHREIAEQGR